MAGSTFKTLKKVHDQATVAAGSDLIAATLNHTNGILEIAICVDSSTPVQLSISDTSDDTAGTVVELVGLNGGAALTAGEGYVFTWPAVSGQTYALRNKSTGATTQVRSGVMRVEVPVG